MENTLASGSIALTDATFSSAISSYLGESEAAAIDGNVHARTKTSRAPTEFQLHRRRWRDEPFSAKNRKTFPLKS